MADNDEPIISKALLFEEYKQNANRGLIITFFNRFIFIILLLFITVFLPSNKAARIPLSGITAFLYVFWSIENIVIQKRLRLISRFLLRAEEGRYEKRWEDSYIQYDYLSSKDPFYMIRGPWSFIEPILWFSFTIWFMVYFLRGNP